MWRNHRMRGACTIAIGVGIMLALVLPVGVIMFLTGATLVFLGLTWMRKC